MHFPSDMRDTQKRFFPTRGTKKPLKLDDCWSVMLSEKDLEPQGEMIKTNWDFKKTKSVGWVYERARASRSSHPLQVRESPWEPLQEELYVPNKALWSWLPLPLTSFSPLGRQARVRTACPVGAQGFTTLFFFSKQALLATKCLVDSSSWI